MKGFLYGQTEYNLKASTTRLEDYVSEAKKNHFDFLTITDPNLHAAYKFYTLCEKEKIKPVIGLEYFIRDEDQSLSRVILYARNNHGYQNLLKITSGVKIHGFETMDDIRPYLSDLVLIFILQDSFLERLFCKEAYSILDEYLAKVRKLKGYIGTSLSNCPERTNVTLGFMKYAGERGIPSVPVHQVKYLNPEDSIIYEALTKIGGAPDTIGEFDDYSFYHNPKEDPAVDSIISSINLNLFKDKITLPKFPNTKGVPSNEYLYALCHKGLERRGKNIPVYLDRLSYELSIIHRMGYDDYFLIVWDFIKYSKQNGILVGPGRGSAAGSLVAYCLGITEVDPLKYDLLFERFLNPERVSMPDIDTDFPDIDRDKVIKHVKELYGEMHVCNITAFGTFKMKSSVRDLARVFGYEKERVEKILDMVEQKGYDVLLEEYKGNEMYNFLYVARGLEGLPSHIGTHAAGIILSESPLDEIIPLSQGINDLNQSQMEAPDLEKIGLLKMDFLGISNLTMIAGMMKDIPGFDMAKLRSIPLDDPKVYRMLQNADTLGLFQLESQGIRNVLYNLKPTSFMDIVAVLALYRPGPMDNIPEFIRRKHGERVVYLHRDLEPILKDTYGVIVYQEQIMKIAQVFAGYSLGEADLLRRAVSKKDAAKLQAMSQDFISRSIQKGYSRDIAQSIYDLIYKFADYGFNKSHSVAYALLSYQMAYFKANYFPVFMSNIMNNVISSTTTLVGYINYAKARGLYTQKPNINISTGKFVFVKNWLFMPLSSVFSIGDAVTNQIVEEREKNGLFKNFEDFQSRCSFLSESTVQALIYAGALDLFGRTKKSMLDNSTRENAIFFKHIDNVVSKEEEYSFAELRQMEKKYLGLNIEYNLFRNVKEYYQKYHAVTLSQLQYKSFAIVIASIPDMKEIKTKKGDRMLVGSLEDEGKTVRFVIFPKSYQEINPSLLDTNSLYVIRGILDKDNHNDDSFTVNHIERID